MNDREQAWVLARCLEAIAQGESPAACVARYPEQGPELAAMLLGVQEIGRLDNYDLSPASRVRAKARLRQAQVDHHLRAGARACWHGLNARPALVRAALALTVAVVLGLALSAGIVAASQPGEPSYGVRIFAERLPAWLVPDAKAQLKAELGLATRRLAEIEAGLQRAPEQLDARTIAALVASDQRAAMLASHLPLAERSAVSARLEEQAHMLQHLGSGAIQPQDAQRLRAAAILVEQAARRVWPTSTQPSTVPRQTDQPNLPATRGTSGERPAAAASPRPPEAPTSSLAPTAAPTPQLPAGTAYGNATAGTPAAQRAGRSLPPATSQGTETSQPGRAAPTATSARPTPAFADPGPATDVPGPGPATSIPGRGPSTDAPGPGPAPDSPGSNKGERGGR